MNVSFRAGASECHLVMVSSVCSVCSVSVIKSRALECICFLIILSDQFNTQCMPCRISCSHSNAGRISCSHSILFVVISATCASVDICRHGTAVGGTRLSTGIGTDKPGREQVEGTRKLLRSIMRLAGRTARWMMSMFCECSSQTVQKVLFAPTIQPVTQI